MISIKYTAMPVSTSLIQTGLEKLSRKSWRWLLCAATILEICSNIWSAYEESARSVRGAVSTIWGGIPFRYSFWFSRNCLIRKTIGCRACGLICGLEQRYGNWWVNMKNTGNQKITLRWWIWSHGRTGNRWRWKRKCVMHWKNYSQKNWKKRTAGEDQKVCARDLARGFSRD